MKSLRAEAVIRVPIRRIPVIVDIDDPLAPGLALDDFRRLHGKEPSASHYRTIEIEVITSPDDQQPMLVSECARYSRFFRREGDSICFYREANAI